MNENWLERLMAAIPSDKCLDQIKIETHVAKFSTILRANLTLHARTVKFRTLRGALFDNPVLGEQKGIQGLASLNEHYELVSYELIEHQLIVRFKDLRNSHSILIDRHIR